MATDRVFTIEELETYDQDADKQYLAIDGVVVDITEYKYEHPGGEDIILEQAGQDASESFDNAGHSNDARKKLKQLAVGTLKESENKKPAAASTTTAQTKPKQEGGIMGALKYALIPLVLFGATYAARHFFKF